MNKIRFTIVGDSCGKTSLIQRWCTPSQPINPSKTIAIDMRSMTFKLVRVWYVYSIGIVAVTCHSKAY